MEAESGTENEHESEDDTDTENDPNNTIRSKSPIPAINVQSTSGIVPPYILPKSEGKKHDTLKKDSSDKNVNKKAIFKFYKNGHCNKEEGKCSYSILKVEQFEQNSGDLNTI